MRTRSITVLLGALLLPTISAAAVAGVPEVALPGTASAAPASVLMVDPNVDAFMAARNGAPVWLGAPGSLAAIQKLASILRRAPLDGLPAGPMLAGQVEAMARAPASGDPLASARADRFLSSAWLAYVAALNVNRSELVYADTSLAMRAPSALETLKKLALAPSLADHLDSVAAVNPVYASIRDTAWASMQRRGVTTADPRLLQNLARARALPRSGRFVVVNAATQRLTMVEDGRIADSMKIIVGTSATPTPMLASMIWYATVNPYWYVPTNLTQKIVAVRMQANPDYLNVKHYEVISDFGESPTVLSPKGIDWKAVQAGKTIVYLRQLPGEKNSMGKMKFSFPSDTGVYLHDTDLPGLFAKDPRTLSNGCVRLEDAQRLGRWMMGREVNAVTGAREEHLVLPRGIPVFLTYITARVENGEVAFVHDVYGRDVKGAVSVIFGANLGGRSPVTEVRL